MWTALFPNWEEFKVFFFVEKDLVKNILHERFIYKLLKKCPSHVILLLIPINSCNPFYFLKAYYSRPLKRNRLKDFQQKIVQLKNLKVPVLNPLLVFYKTSLKALLKKEIFYGGLLYPYIKEGFLQKKYLFSRSEQSKVRLEKLVEFIFSLHEKKLLLEDTKFSNFYYKEEEGFKIFDLDGVKLLKNPPSPKQRLRDLSSLAMTLEWEGLKEIRENIFEYYSKLFPFLEKKDFTLFSEYIAKRKERRRKKLQKFLS